MDTYALIRSIARESFLTSETTTVILENGKELPSYMYALAYVKKYALDSDAIHHCFGAHVSYEDLQSEMLCTLVKAARAYAKVGNDGTPYAFRRYLSKYLKARLYDIDTKAPRARFNRCSGEWQEMPPYISESLEEFLRGIEQEDAYPQALTVESVASEIDDLATVTAFLAGLTERQQKIVRLRFDHTPGTNDGMTLKDVAALLEINEKTVRRELILIQGKFIEYASATSTEDWLLFLKGVGKS